MCWATTVGGASAGNCDSSWQIASVPPIDAPIANRAPALR
jgi:hypothetical protein